MKNLTENSTLTPQDRFGLRLVARLSEATDVLPHNITERLRASRFQALDKYKQINVVAASAVQFSGGAAILGFGGEERSLWRRAASLVPLLALIAGLLAVNMLDKDARARELAEIDAAILTDDLPPAAYTDPGFAQFLSARRDQSQ
jgi:hypothetical protein